VQVQKINARLRDLRLDQIKAAFSTPASWRTAGVQAEWAASRGTGCRERNDRSWAEGDPKRAEGGALRTPM
jgi:hypothetical protein